jgi:hypothetical protein
METDVFAFTLDKVGWQTKFEFVLFYWQGNTGTCRDILQASKNRYLIH